MLPGRSVRVRRDLFAILGILAGALSAHSPACADTIYGITNDDNLLKINTSDPTAATAVGTLDTVSASLGLFFNGSSLYVYDTNNNVLRQINPATAATVSTINIGLAALPGEGDVAFQNGVGFLASTDAPDGSFSTTGTLFRFTLTGNSATVVSAAIPQLDGLAFSSTGTLYGLSQGGAALYTINTSTGVATEVGTGTGIAGTFGFGGLAFGPSGTLFAGLADFSDPSHLYSIDPLTGTAVSIGAVPFNQVSGLTSVVVPTPEPSSFLLIGAFLLMGGVLRRALPRSS